MASYESGLSYAKLREAADSNALDTLSKGSCSKNGSKYQAKASYVDARGIKPKRVYLTHTLEGTSAVGRSKTGTRELKKKVSDWVESVRRDIKAVAGLDSDPSRSVRECVRWFIDQKEKRDDDGNMIGARASTLTFYRACAKRLEKSPALASMPLIKVRESDVQGWIDELSKSYAHKSVKDSLRLLSMACSKILGKDKNPCDGVQIPKSIRKDKYGNRQAARPNTLNEGGVMRLNSFLDEREAKYDGIDLMVVGVRIALNTGMRAEEVSGLRWRDVDFTNHTLYVRNAIERAELPVTNDDGEKTYDVDGNLITRYAEFDSDTKTVGSRRDIHMTASFELMLKSHKANVCELLAAQFEKESNRPNIEDLYVIGRTDGTHYSPHRLGANFKKFARKNNLLGTNGVVIGFHGLRDTFATLSLGHHHDSPSEISVTLGHSNLTTTMNRYIGKDKEKQKKFLEGMESIFNARTPDDVLSIDRTGTEG